MQAADAPTCLIYAKGWLDSLVIADKELNAKGEELLQTDPEHVLEIEPMLRKLLNYSDDACYIFEGIYDYHAPVVFSTYFCFMK